MDSLKVTLVPVQSGSGDPSPTNVRPISGHTEVKVARCGKNMLGCTVAEIKANNTNGTWSGNTFNRRGVDFTLVADEKGYVTEVQTSGTATGEIFFRVYKDFIYKAGKSYVLSGCPSGGTSDTYRFESDNLDKRDYGNGVTISLNADTIDSIFVVAKTNANMNGLIFKPMLRFSEDTDPTFKPYKGDTYTIDLDGTRYGGVLDVTTGELTVDRAMVTYDGSEDEGWSLYSGDPDRFVCAKPTGAGTTGGFTGITLSNICVTSNSVAVDNSVFIGGSNVNVRIDNLTLAQFTTLLSGTPMTLVYPLATPQVIQLTPTQVETLVGTNNLVATLAGQTVTESQFRPVITIDDVNDLVEKTKDYADDAIQTAVTPLDTRVGNLETTVNKVSWTASVNKLTGDTSATITDAKITTSSIVEPFSSNSSGNTVIVTKITVTTGQAVIYFDALAEATSFKARITNL